MKKWLLFALAALTVWLRWANCAVEVNEWVVESDKIPDAFDGFRIAQISDLHNGNFGPGNGKVLKLLAETEPDIIVITGDLLDSRNTDVGAALEFVRGAVEIAPCYYVSGNHENRVEAWRELRLGLLDLGVVVLEDEGVALEREGAEILLAGVRDPDFGGDFDAALEAVTARVGYTILLSHRPERMDRYAAAGADLVFSGHAHGGQIRIPFLGGLIAPHQGWWTEYDSGMYREGDTVMLVSRGVGNSIIPLRINDRPEIILAILKSK